ncbi:peroxidase family protein [Roseibacillus persicicus]|uniref:peroxidase family protein n=1 Tax=Roseibacillus persicicus TaxID=454148 RepID=UPI00280F0098|nr:peroxidase family protein [Roseibacillus persicicus]MDQ8189308.1 peroxidase family protein [Roseibacillus persicicus]
MNPARASQPQENHEKPTPIQVGETAPLPIVRKSARLWLPALGFSFFVFAPAYGQSSDDSQTRDDRQLPLTPRPMKRSPQATEESREEVRREREEVDLDLPAEIAPIDGYGNNVENPFQGAAEQPFIRLVDPAYADGESEPSGADRPNARAISNAICAQSESMPNALGATDYLWQWGQFLDHDIVETPTIDPAEPFNITIPADDIWFTPGSEMPMNRSFYEEHSSPREQINALTSYIDGSMIYGSTEARAYALRALDGSGRLRVTDSDFGDLLPYNFTGLDNAPVASPNYFLAGDVRANEQVGLTAMHTLFVREHNQWAARYLEENSDGTGEEAYQFARLIVTAEIQAITYREFLPILLGERALPPYEGYDPEVDASIANEFGSAAYRMGHTMLSSQLLRLDAEGEETAAGHLSLADAFFNPIHIEENGIDSILRGLAAQTCQELDEKLVDEVRNLLFGPPGSGGFDLATLNIQRGRDHGLPDYNTLRRAARLRPARRLRDINPELEETLREVYESPDQVDLWVGCLSEPKVPGAMVGPLLHRIMVNQFTRLRDGDRFHYLNHLPAELVKMVEKQTFATIIRRNTDIGDELQENVFLSAEETSAGRSSNNRDKSSQDSRRR